MQTVQVTNRGWGVARCARLTTRRAAIAIGGLSVLLAAGAAGAQAPEFSGTTPDTATGQIIERILVKVNGDIITQTEIENRQITAMRDRGYLPNNEAELREALIEVTPGVITTAVSELLIVQQGRMLGYALSDDQFDELVTNIKVENNLEDDEEFEQALAQNDGMTLRDLRQLLERQMLIQQVQQIEVFRKVILTETEAREYYNEHLDDFTEVATITLREIMIAVADAGGGINAAADDQALAAAGAARQRVLDGEEFSMVAVAVSDSPSKANGGLIGPLEYGLVNEAIQNVVDGLEVGDISAPIRTPAGYQVLQLEDRTDPTPIPFDDVKQGIGDTVFSDRRVQEYTRFLTELRDQADIEWKDEQLRHAYEEFELEQLITAPGAGN